MAIPVLDTGAFSNAELQTMLTTAKAEYLRRISDGAVTQGSSAAQSFGMTKMTVDDLVRLINSLTTTLGLDTAQVLVQPNFNTQRPPAPGCFDGTFGAS
jgi:signal transduction histidine kinase